MTERVRLVIWDLDETFWKGTLSEGGHTYLEANHDIVVELARRGIVSSICSKNDFALVEDVLRKSGIWDYFVFPSISWEPKGARIRDLIEAIGLRPPTVMLIDDNPMNLRETLHFVPDIQADETFIGEILTSPLFIGKDDRALTRLSQYKTLERRRSDEMAAGRDNREFLRVSNLRVQIDHDIEGNIERVIELINRTNQLNFTKRRLSEDALQARKGVMELFEHFATQAGLVKVQDSYGDYGICGIYIVNTFLNQLWHFCFSCRIMNMGIERWLYDKLGRPEIYIVGDVVTNLLAPGGPVDWINVEQSVATSSQSKMAFDTAILRGGCELQAVAHYTNLSVRKTVGDLRYPAWHGVADRSLDFSTKRNEGNR